MDNEKFQELVLQQLQSLAEGQKTLTEGQNSLGSRMDNLDSRMDNLDSRMDGLDSRMDSLEKSQDKLAAELMGVKADVKEVNAAVIKLENDITPKIGALFEGYSLRGEQIENLGKRMDERFDGIESDIRYLVSRVAGLEKVAK